MNLTTICFMVQSFVCLLACVYCYTLGARHGRAIQGGGVPSMPNPIKAVKDAVEDARESEKEREADENMSAILSVSKESMLEAMIEERAKSRKVRM